MMRPPVGQVERREVQFPLARCSTRIEQSVLAGCSSSKLSASPSLDGSTKKLRPQDHDPFDLSGRHTFAPIFLRKNYPESLLTEILMFVEFYSLRIVRFFT